MSRCPALLFALLPLPALGADVTVTLDVTHDALWVEMDLSEIPEDPPPWVRIPPGNPWGISGLEASTDAGSAHVRYQVQLGRPGRHGHQGWLSDELALIDGSGLLIPTSAAPDDRIRVRYRVPGGWRIATPLRPLGAPSGGWGIEPLGTESSWRVLATTCVGLGRLEVEQLPIGGLRLSVWTPSALPPQRREALIEGTAALGRYFQQVLGLELPHPYVVVHGPDTPDSLGMFAGAGARGACATHRGDRRSWELLAHRMAHVIDRDPPTGFVIAEPEDRWFVEGWASYTEAIATAEAGLAPRGHRLDALRARWRHDVAAHPDWRVPLASEPHAAGALREHLHYVRGPVVVDRLARILRERTGRELQVFVAQLYARHGGREVSLRRSLEAWSGVDLGDVWAAHVDRYSGPDPTGRSER